MIGICSAQSEEQLLQFEAGISYATVEIFAKTVGSLYDLWKRERGFRRV